MSQKKLNEQEYFFKLLSEFKAKGKIFKFNVTEYLYKIMLTKKLPN